MKNGRTTDGQLEVGAIIKTAVYRKTGEPICMVDTMDEINRGTTDAEIARRLVACWNACEGVPTEALERKVAYANQRAAVSAFCAANGRGWKEKLASLWLSGNYKRSGIDVDQAALLQQARNQLGPQWLMKVADADLTIAPKSLPDQTLGEESNSKLPRVLVVVSGGVADPVYDEGVDVEVFDWDDYNDDPTNTSGVPNHFSDLAQSIGVPVEGDAQ
jgi:hypothetical protein